MSLKPSGQGQEGQESRVLGLMNRRVAELRQEMIQIESWTKEMGTLVATETRRFQEIRGRFDAIVAALEEDLNAKVGALENQIKEKEELLEIYQGEIQELRSQVALLQTPSKESLTLEDEIRPSHAQGIKESIRDVEVRHGRIEKTKEGQDQRRSSLASLLAPTKKSD